MFIAMMDIKSLLPIEYVVHTILPDEVLVLDTETGLMEVYPTSYIKRHLVNVALSEYKGLVYCGISTFSCRALDLGYLFRYRIVYWQGYMYVLPMEAGLVLSLQVDGDTLYVYTGEAFKFKDGEGIYYCFGYDSAFKSDYVIKGEKVTYSQVRRRILMEFGG